MRYAHLLASLRSTPWAALPATIQTVSDLLSARVRGLRPPRADDGLPWEGDDAEPADTPPPPLYQIAAPGVALVEARGIIGKHLSGMAMLCGGCDVERVGAALEAAAEDAGVRSIVLHLDTPGGTVPGVPELASRIRHITTRVPVYGFVDDLCASAGYWIASACSGIFATPTASLGSIGVYMALVDESQAWAEQGWKLVLVKAGTFKAAGTPGSEITDEQVAQWQQGVDALYAMFAADVRRGRPAVADESMQGQCFLGAAAQAVGLVDQIVADRDEVLASLAIALPAPAAAAPAL
jgi:protease-4